MPVITITQLVDGTVPVAADFNTPLNGLNTATWPVAQGGTNLTSYAVGDLLYASAAAVLAKLAAVATGNVLISGGVATAPSWGKVDLSVHLSAVVLPATNFPALTGDVTTVAGALATTMKNTGPGATGPIGSATVAPVITIDAQGRVTALTSATISAAVANNSVVTRTAGDVTTTSTSLVDLTSATITMTTGARRVLLGLAGASSNTATATHLFAFVVDGTVQPGTDGYGDGNAINGIIVSLGWLTNVLTAASHTFKVQWRVSAGTGTVEGSATRQLRMWAIEEQS